LKKADFSDIFTARLRSELPLSLKFLIDALDNKPVGDLILSDNAFGPDGV
jgi:Ran GTPase-activating protein 1